MGTAVALESSYSRQARRRNAHQGLQQAAIAATSHHVMRKPLPNSARTCGLAHALRRPPATDPLITAPITCSAAHLNGVVLLLIPHVRAAAVVLVAVGALLRGTAGHGKALHNTATAYSGTRMAQQAAAAVWSGDEQDNTAKRRHLPCVRCGCFVRMPCGRRLRASLICTRPIMSRPGSLRLGAMRRPVCQADKPSPYLSKLPRVLSVAHLVRPYVFLAVQA